MRYESLSAKLPFITKLNVLCEKLDMSLTNTQLPMFCRLIELCIALYYGTLELPASSTATETEETVDGNLKQKEGLFSILYSFICIPSLKRRTTKHTLHMQCE